MMPLLLAIGGVLALLTMLSPRWGTYCFWFVTLLYPSSLLYAMLPFNIRFDDLFLVWLTVACVRIAPPDVLTSRAFRMAALWYLSILAGNVVGLLTGPEYIRWAVFKGLGKALYVPMVTYALVTVVRDERQLRRMLGMILLASIGTFVIGIVQVKAPHLTAMWETPSDELARLTMSEMGEALSETDRRAGGSIGIASLSATATCIALLGLRMVARAATLAEKVWYGGAAVLAMITLGFTIARGPIVGFLAALVYSVVGFGRRALAILVLTLGLAGVLTTTDLGDRIWNRIVSQRGEVHWQESADFRAYLWHVYLAEFSVHYLLFGRGWTAEFVRHNAASAHSSYVGAIAYTGLFGTVVLAWYVMSAWRMARRLTRIDPEPLGRCLGEGLILSMVAALVSGISAEHWQGTQLVLCALIALTDARLRMLEGEDLVQPLSLSHAAARAPTWERRTG